MAAIDKAATLEAQAAAAAAELAARTRSLDPEFPFVIEEFDPDI